MTPTAEQLAELRDALTGGKAMLLPDMPAWYLDLDVDEKDEAIKAATRLAPLDQADGLDDAEPRPVASDDRGAWTCSLCGFRGFWYGGPHC